VGVWTGPEDKTITEMEEAWSTLILPMSESAFAREPLTCIEGEDYTHFEATYGFTETTADSEMLRHSEWVRSVYGMRPKEKGEVGIDGKRLLTEQRTFEDSRDSIGLQMTDMPASILRRALNDRLPYSGWKDFGRLLVRHHDLGTGFIQLGPGGDVPMLGHAKKVCQVLHGRAKDMVAARRNGPSPVGFFHSLQFRGDPGSG